MPRKFGEAAQESVETAMHKMKRGQLKSGRSDKTVKSKNKPLQLGSRKHERKEPKSRRKKNKLEPSNTLKLVWLVLSC
jgi:hypothetical protein